MRLLIAHKTCDLFRVGPGKLSPSSSLVEIFQQNFTSSGTIGSWEKSKSFIAIDFVIAVLSERATGRQDKFN